MKLNWRLIIPLLVGMVLTISFEIYGATNKGSGDTITELWEWVDKHLPPFGQFWLLIITLGLLTWAIAHFVKRAKDGV